MIKHHYEKSQELRNVTKSLVNTFTIVDTLEAFFFFGISGENRTNEKSLKMGEDKQ